MYEHDPIARSIARRSLADGTIAKLPLVEQLFMMLPLGHSERIEDQEMNLAWAEHTLEQARARSLPGVPMYEFGSKRSRLYLDIIARFGRFPHRNAILGRTSSADEAEFMSANPMF
jgi:uncharacterized protein (DUF924 family)